jgi:copper(I)-binding protein
VIVSAPATGTGNPAVAISGLATPPVVGTTVPVTFTFANAGTVTVQAPVRDAAVA